MHTPLPPLWLVTPFVLLLSMIATGPVVYPHFWHRHYGKVAPTLGLLVIGYYVTVLSDYQHPIETIAEYVQFIALIAASYMASSTIALQLHLAPTVWANLLVLWSGAFLANFIGTTGASMLLIKPYLRLNKGRTQAYHVVFFIFIVSNIGGALTPIGDPPLFLGYLKGVPFFWVVRHVWAPWLVALGLLSLLFYALEHFASTTPQATATRIQGKPLCTIRGATSIGWLLLIVLAVFIDPNLSASIPCISYHSHKLSFVRECLLLGIALGAYLLADKARLAQNGFSWEPLREVVLVFMGIFGTMMPALALIKNFAESNAGTSMITPTTLYWSTGILSSCLDNAPTYLNFLAAGMASVGLDIGKVADVVAYATQQAPHLGATSMAAVFFGAMTYVGNGPNFMVKAIAEEEGVAMPSFASYILRFALPLLLPILVVVWACFVSG